MGPCFSHFFKIAVCFFFDVLVLWLYCFLFFAMVFFKMFVGFGHVMVIIHELFDDTLEHLLQKHTLNIIVILVTVLYCRIQSTVSATWYVLSIMLRTFSYFLVYTRTMQCWSCLLMKY